HVRAHRGNLLADLGAGAAAEGDHGDEGAHADDDAQRGQQRAEAVAGEGFYGDPEQTEDAHSSLRSSKGGRRRFSLMGSSAMRPSRNTTTRRAYSAMSGSCVTRTMVMPRSSFMRMRMPITSSLVRESRLPVGSSASSSGAPVTKPRAMATRCC